MLFSRKSTAIYSATSRIWGYPFPHNLTNNNRYIVFYHDGDPREKMVSHCWFNRSGFHVVFCQDNLIFKINHHNNPTGGKQRFLLPFEIERICKRIKQLAPKSQFKKKLLRESKDFHFSSHSSGKTRPLGTTDHTPPQACPIKWTLGLKIFC